MTEQAEQQQPAPEAQDGPSEGEIRRFEKAFRMLDASIDGEAEAAFRTSRKLIGRIGLTFAQLLEMASNTGGGANEEELRAIIEEYRVANEQLKSAEGIVVSENERLNFLLRHFRDAKVQVEGLKPEPFKKSLVDVVERIGKISDDVAKMTLSDDPEEMERIYLARMGEALLPHKGHITKGWFDKMMVWSLKKAGRDISPEGILNLQDLVLAQEKIIREQAAMIQELKTLQAQSAEVYEQLQLLVSASAPESEYNKALLLLRDAQLALGDGQDIKNLQAQAKTLEHQVDTLSKENAALGGKVGELTAKLAEASQREPEVIYVDKSGEKVGSRKAYQAPPPPAAVAAAPPQDPKYAADSAEFKMLESRAALQEQTIRELQAQLAQHRISGFLDSEEARFVAQMRHFLPVLQDTKSGLDEAVDLLRRPPEPPKTLKEKIYAKVAGAFGKKDARRKKLMEEVAKVRDTAQTVHRAYVVIDEITDEFNSRTHGVQDRAEQGIRTYFDKASADFASRFGSAEKAFRDSIDGAHQHGNAAHANAEKARQDAIRAMDEEIEKRAAELARLREMERKLEAEISGMPKEKNKKKGGQKASAVSDSQRDVASRMLLDRYNAGDTAGMGLLLAKGADINTRFQGEQTMLIHAVHAQNMPMIEFLLSKGADVFAHDNEGRDVMSGLKANWKNGQNRDKAWNLVVAHMDDMRPAPAVAQAQTTVDAAAQEQRNAVNQAMFLALGRADKDAFRLAIQKGADINAFDGGMTPMMKAIWNGRYDMLPVVLECQPDVLIQNKDGKNIFDLIMARNWNSHADRQKALDACVAALPDNPLPRSAREEDPQARQTALNDLLLSASNSGYKKTMEMALAKGADIDMPIQTTVNSKVIFTRGTLLMSYVIHENADMACFVLEKGADIYRKDAEGKTVFDHIKKSWNSGNAKQKIMEALLDVIGKNLTQPAAAPVQPQSPAGAAPTP